MSIQLEFKVSPRLEAESAKINPMRAVSGVSARALHPRLPFHPTEHIEHSEPEYTLKPYSPPKLESGPC